MSEPDCSCQKSKRAAPLCCLRARPAVLVESVLERYSFVVTANFPDKLYERVANKIASLIDRGTLRRGDRLPSVRDCSRQEKVSVATVPQAYLSLESQGLIEVRPKSGH